MSCRSCYVLSPNDLLQRSQNGNQSPSAGRANSCLSWQFNRNPLLLKAKFDSLIVFWVISFHLLNYCYFGPGFKSVMNANADSMLWSLDLRKPKYPLNLMLLGAPKPISVNKINAYLLRRFRLACSNTLRKQRTWWRWLCTKGGWMWSTLQALVQSLTVGILARSEALSGTAYSYSSRHRSKAREAFEAGQKWSAGISIDSGFSWVFLCCPDFEDVWCSSPITRLTS